MTLYGSIESMNLVTFDKMLFLHEIYTFVLKYIDENNTAVSCLAFKVEFAGMQSLFHQKIRANVL